MTGLKWDKAVTSPPKHGVHAANWVSPTIFSVLNLPLSIEHHCGKQIEVHCCPQSFKKSDLPEGLNYEVLHCTIVPTVISYYAHQRDPWDQQVSVLCNEIWVTLKSAGGMDFEVNPRGPIYQIVSWLYNCYYYYYSFKLLGHSMPIWQLVHGYQLCFPGSYHNVYLQESTGVQ